MNEPQPRPARCGLDSLIAVRSEKPSRMAETISTPNATYGFVIGSGCRILWTPSYTEYAPPTENSTTATRNP